jgi:hypothetical protein
LGAAIETASMLLSSSTRRKSANAAGAAVALPAFFPSILRVRPSTSESGSTTAAISTLSRPMKPLRWALPRPLRPSTAIRTRSLALRTEA